MRRALALAARGYGGTSPNPMVGAVLVRAGKIVGEGYHQRAGEAHAEVNAIRAAGKNANGAVLYVTLEPCSTIGKTPPCTDAIAASGIRRVIIATRDPNPLHAGIGLRVLRRGSIEVSEGLFASEAERLNEIFNFWITERSPFVHLKCAMSLDGKIASTTGESKWITGVKARAYGMRLRLGVDAIVAGVNTVIRDNPALTMRGRAPSWKRLRRVVLDPRARTPLTAKVVTEDLAGLTSIVVSPEAPRVKVQKLARKVRIIEAPVTRTGELNLHWLLRALEKEGVTSILVEGGGETHFNFLAQDLVNRVHFLYAPMIITGRSAPKSVGGAFTLNNGAGLKLHSAEWKNLGEDLLLTALCSRELSKKRER